jgi:hypothetical protein
MNKMDHLMAENNENNKDSQKGQVTSKKYFFNYLIITFSRTLVFGQSGRTKGPLLFFMGSVLLWAYPMYFLRVSFSLL